MRLSTKVYTGAETVDDAFQQLLMENSAGFRRLPDPVAMHMENPEVVDLLNYFEDALYGIYSFYATAADAKRRVNTKSAMARHRVNTMKECLGTMSFSGLHKISG